MLLIDSEWKECLSSSFLWTDLMPNIPSFHFFPKKIRTRIPLFPWRYLLSSSCLRQLPPNTLSAQSRGCAFVLTVTECNTSRAEDTINTVRTRQNNLHSYTETSVSVDLSGLHKWDLENTPFFVSSFSSLPVNRPFVAMENISQK